MEEEDDESTLIENLSDRAEDKQPDIENNLLQKKELESEKVYLSYKNNIAAIGDKFVDKNNNEIIVSHPKIIRFVGITCIAAVISWVVLLVIYSNSHLLHKLFPTLGLIVSQLKNIIISLIGQIGFIAMICFTSIISLVIFILYHVLGYQKSYKSEQGIDKTILDNYDDYAYLMTNGLLAVKKNDKWGFINRKGKIIIPLIYDLVCVFKDGKAKVELDGEEMMINTKGKRISN